MEIKDLEETNLADCDIDEPTYKTSIWNMKNLHIEGDVDLTQDDIDCINDATILSIDQAGTVVDEAFTLPTVGANGSQITWVSSDSSSLQISGNTAIPIRKDNSTNVTLTATIIKNSSKETKEFSVTVKANEVINFATSDWNIDENTGTVSISVTDDGNLSSLFSDVTLLAYKENAQGEKTTAITTDTKGVNELNAPLSVDVGAVTTGEKIKYFLLGDGNVSLKDNAPSAVKEFTVDPKVKAINLSWTPSEDDSGKVVKYNLYKDNELLEENIEMTSYQLSSDGEEHTFKIAAVDTANNASEYSESGKVLPVAMYRVSADGAAYGVSRRENNGSYVTFSEGTVTVGGVEYTAYTCDATSKARYIAFVKSDDCGITSEDSELVFEIEYLDRGTDSLTFSYNSVPRSNESESWRWAMRKFNFATCGDTDTWKTAVFKVTDAKLVNDSTSSSASFMIDVPEGTPVDTVWIKEIRVIQYDKYGAEVVDKTP